MGDYRLVQISDVHLTEEGTLARLSRPRDNLLAALERVVSAGDPPDAFVLTGDLANEGAPSCYEDLARILDNLAERTGAIAVCLPGNHDDRAALRRHLCPDAGGPGATGSDPVNQVVWLGGLRIVALDSTVPGEDRGDLGLPTLRFLDEALAAPAPDGTVLAFHHPPVPSPIEQMSRIALERPDLLAGAIAGSDVRLIICGHNHHPALATLGNVPVWVGPATAYRADVASRASFRAVAGCAVSQIDLDERGPVITVIECQNFPP